MAASGGIHQLNSALEGLKGDLMKIPQVAESGEIAIITFGQSGVQVQDPTGTGRFDPQHPYVPINEFRPSPLHADGVTPMGQAIQRGLEVLDARKEELRRNGVNLAFRPLMFVVSDGEPTDEYGHPSDNYRQLLPMLREQERNKQLLFYAIGVDQANEAVLRELAPADGQSYMLAGIDFATVFSFMSTSVEVAIASDRAEQAVERIFGRTADRINTLGELGAVGRGYRDRYARACHRRTRQ